MRNRRWTTTVWAMCAGLGITLSAGTVYAATDDTIRDGEQSEWVAQYVDNVAEQPAIDPAANTDEGTDKPHLDTTFGPAGPATTLVIYDGDAVHPARAEMDAIAAGNLATHFGQTRLLPVAEYTEEMMGDYDAAIYVGSGRERPLPASFLDDVREGATPVLWLGENIGELTGDATCPDGQDFVDTHGWMAGQPIRDAGGEIDSVHYEDVELSRRPRPGDALQVPEILDETKVEVLATAECSGGGSSGECSGSEAEDDAQLAWAIRSGHLTYVAERPFHYMSEDSQYLAAADLYYDLLAPDTEPVQRAAVRIEDVGPESDPEDLYRIADYLHDNDVPFQVAVMPIHVAKVPESSPTRWYGRSLLDTPDVVEALHYMTERGGVLIQHGTTHQYGATDNPYDGTTGADYEFYRSVCSATEEGPLEEEQEPCESDSWVRLTGPVADDAVDDHAQRLAEGRRVMVEAGLEEPTIFEVPHYAASANAYVAIEDAYEARHERAQYFAGLTTGENHPDEMAFTQFFPYRVQDIYGTTVLPENVGNPTEEPLNHHPTRPPEFLIDNAAANLVVRESTASFFFHPFLSTEYLDEVVSGITDLGYEFVPATELP